MNPLLCNTAASSQNFAISNWYTVTTTDCSTLGSPSVPDPEPAESANVRWLRKRVDEIRDQAFAA